MKRLIENRLASPYLHLHLALLAFVLLLPALSTGWLMDDEYHRVLLTGKAPIDMTAWQVFSGPPADPETHRTFVEMGVFPWWVSDGFRLSLFRPLSVLTMRIDYWLWPESAALMHFHSLLWFAALVAATTVLYRRMMAPTWVAGLAALLYAIDDAHSGPAAWIANRNALIACLFGVLCLIAHHAWRGRDSRLGALLAPALLAAALAGGEAALATAGYLFAYAVCRESGGWRGRLVSLLPASAVLLGWATLYRLGDYGAHGSAMYIDPVGDPLAYAMAVLRRAPANLMGQWSPLPADLAALAPPELQPTIWWVALGALALLTVLLWPMIRRRPDARFWLLGMLLSVLPICAVFPSNRLLFFVGLGAMALLAEFLAGVWRRSAWLPSSIAWRRFARPTALLLALAHLPLSLVGMPLGALSVLQTGLPARQTAETLPTDPAIRAQELVIVNAPDYLLYVTHIPTYQALAELPAPRRLRVLSTGPSELSVTRTDSHTLRVEIERGLYAGTLGSLFRGTHDELAVGERVQLDGMAATVSGLNGRGEPSIVGYSFDTELEDPARRWIHYVDGRWEEFVLPLVGETRHLESPKGPLDLLY